MHQSLLPIIWLRFQLIKRILAKRSHLPIWLTLALWLIFVVFVLMTSGTMAAIVTIINSKDPVKLTAVLFATLLMLSVLVLVYISLVGLRLKTHLDFRKIAFLPVKRLHFYLTETVSLYIDFWAVFLSVTLLLILISLGLASNAASFFNGLLLVCTFVLFMGAFNHFYIYLLTYLFHLKRKQWFKKLLFFLYLSLGMALVLSPIVLLSKNPFELIEEIDNFLHNKFLLYLLPFGLVADGITQLLTTENSIRLYYLHLPMLVGYTIFFLIAGYQMLRLSEDQYSKNSRSEGFPINLVSGVERLVQLIWKKNRTFVILLAKEISYLMRSNRIILLVLASLLYVMLRLSISPRGDQLHDFEMIVILTLPMLILTSDSTFIFFYDGTATRAYFFNPISCKELITAKNLAFLSIILFDFLILFATVKLLQGSKLNIWIFSASFVLVCYMFFANIMVSNYLAVTNPKKLPYESLFSISHTTKDNSIKVIGAVASIVPVIICFVLFNQSHASIIAGLVALCVLAGISYMVSLAPLSRTLLENQENYIHQLSG